jgi:hypothetical protein
MLDIVGSIDNAWRKDSQTEICHLVFMKDRMVEFKISESEELSEDIRAYLKEDPLKEESSSGLRYTLLTRDKELQKKILEEAELKGMEMEKKMDSAEENGPGQNMSIEYSNIDNILLKNGTSKTPSVLTVKTKGEAVVYMLMHNSYEGAEKLDAVTRSKYKAVLSKALGEKFRLEN